MNILLILSTLDIKRLWSQIPALVQQPVPTRIFTPTWANNIPGFKEFSPFCQIQTLGLGKRSKVPLYSLLKRTPVSLLTGWPLIWKSGLQAGSGSGIQAGWPKRSAMARPAHPCYANPLSCYWTNHALRYVTLTNTYTNMFHRHHQFKTMSAFSALPCLPINCCWS